MSKFLVCTAALCLASQGLADKRFLADVVIKATSQGLEMNANPVGPADAGEFEGEYQWNLSFENNGQTASLNTVDGTWTAENINPAVAAAAVDVGTPLGNTVAAVLGVPNTDEVVSTASGLAQQVATTVGTEAFAPAVGLAVQTANQHAAENGIHVADMNDEVRTGTTTFGENGKVVDASGVTTGDVHNVAAQAATAVTGVTAGVDAATLAGQAAAIIGAAGADAGAEAAPALPEVTPDVAALASQAGAAGALAAGASAADLAALAGQAGALAGAYGAH